MAQLYYTPFTVQPGQFTGTLPNTPILVRGNHSRFAYGSGHVANVYGFDLVWYSDSNLTTRLKFELLKYDASGSFLFYVLVPAVAGLVIYLGYGDTTITTNQSTPSDVWNLYRGTYHLGDGTTLDLNDSSGKGNHLTNFGALTAASGPILGGVQGNGAGYLSRILSIYMTMQLTLQCWIKKSSLGLTGTPMSAMDDAKTAWYGYYCYTNNDFISTASKVYDNRFNGPLAPFNTTDWVLSTAVHNGWNDSQLFINDVLVATDTTLDSIANATNISIGAVTFNAAPGAYIESGIIIANPRFIETTNPTPDQIAATYNAEKIGSAFWSMGSEVIRSGGGSSEIVQLYIF